MGKSIFQQPVALPSLQFVIICLLGITIFTSIFKHDDTIYLINKTVSSIAGDNYVLIGDTTVVASKSQYQQRTQNAKYTSKTFANVQTMILWGFLGLVVYYLAYVFFMVFIHPIESDSKESHYVHANKKYLYTKRLLWCATTAFVTVLSIGLWILMTHIVAPYYQLAIYDFSISTFLIFVMSVVLSMFVVVGIRLGCRVIVRTY